MDAKRIGGIFLPALIYAAMLFGPAMRLTWWQAWVFVAVVVIASAATMLTVFKGNDDLLEERYKSPIQEGQPLADKIVLSLFLLAFAAVAVLIPLDTFRFHLGSQDWGILNYIGLAMFIGGWWVMALALRDNAFAAPVVKHQADRNQHVVGTGVYGVVRHPMYAGFALIEIGMPMWFGSFAALALAVLPILLLAVRITIEEEFLVKALTGYEAYRRLVRYRMIPYLW